MSEIMKKHPLNLGILYAETIAFVIASLAML